MDFKTLPPGPLTLKNVHIPACLLGEDGDLLCRDLHIDGGMLTDTPGTPIEMAGAMVFPAFVDMHTHLDKGQIWPRAANPDGTFEGALTTVRADSARNWHAEDVRQRMTFSLRAAYAHGTRAIRTHLDSIPPQDEISWPVFREVRAEWADRIALQAVCLVGCEGMEAEGRFRRTAEIVAESHGILGMVLYPVPDLKGRIVAFLNLAETLNLAVDFHVDETMDPSSETLRMLAETVLERRFAAPVTVGHCCALSTQAEDRALATLDLVALAGIHVVSLPMCNLYLQDRGTGTPRRRGITLVHEMAARGIPVSFASDNTRDPFYAYGDMDMLEVMREATRIGHLDHAGDHWPHAFLTHPAAACGFAAPNLAPGAPADLVICRARRWTELFARPQADRIVVRAG
ncbi:MAG: cytosine deaminase, partial [Pseudomonadota bacterium]